MTLLLLACSPEDDEDPHDTGRSDPSDTDSAETDSEGGGGPDTGPWTAGTAVPIDEVRAATWRAARWSLAGTAVAVAGGDVLVGEPSLETGVGAVYVVPGGAAGDGELGEVENVLRPADEGGYFGGVLAAVPDLDGDGLAEVAIGQSHAIVSSDGLVGAAYLLSGPPRGAAWLDRSEPIGFAVVEGGQSEDRLGCGLGFGDFDGDGAADFAVGAWRAYHNPPDPGILLVYDLGIAGLSRPEDAELSVEGQDTDADFLGSAFVATDADGDGVGDIGVAAVGEGTGGCGYVLHGPNTGALSVADAELRICEPAELAGFGYALADGGDLDGDGLPELVFGAYEDDGAGEWAGRAWLVPGGLGGDLLSSALATSALGEQAYDMLGAAVAGPADVSGDGQADLVVAAPANPYFSWSPGKVYVWEGPLPTGSLDLADSSWVLVGRAAGSRFGHSVAVGDLDGDLGDDLVIGSPYHGGGRADTVFASTLWVW